MEARVGVLVQRLTRHPTRYSTQGTLQIPFSSRESDPPVNPQSPNFSVRKWMKLLLAIRFHDPDRHSDQLTGVSFKTLSVHGFGSPTDDQKDALGCLFEAGRMIRRLAGI